MNVQQHPRVQEIVAKISSLRNIPQEEILNSFLEIFNSPFVQTDATFVTDEDRIEYSLSVLWSRYVLRPPVREVEIVPIGISSPRLTKSGELMCNIFVLSSTSKKPVRLVLRGREVVERRKSILLGAKYKVKVGTFSTGDLVGDERTIFEDPRGLEIPLDKLLTALGIPSVPKLADLSRYASNVDESGYVDTSDWRKVEGIIIRKNKGQRKDGTDFWCYTISDTSIEPSPDTFPGVTVWVDETQFLYREEDHIIVYGTVHLGNEPYINGYLVLPKHVRK
jgi:hypothetical protein